MCRFTPLFEFMRAQVLTLSGAVQREIHGLIASYFTKEKTDALRPVMRSIVEDVLASVDEREQWDVVTALGKKIPMRAVAFLLGLPADVCPLLVEWTDIVECVTIFVLCFIHLDRVCCLSCDLLAQRVVWWC